MQKLLVELEGIWKKQRPELLARLRPRATDEQILKFERAVGCSLGSELAALYAWHDGSEDDDVALEGVFGWSSLEAMEVSKRDLDELERSGDFTDNDWPRGSRRMSRSRQQDRRAARKTTGSITSTAMLPTAFANMSVRGFRRSWLRSGVARHANATPPGEG